MKPLLTILFFLFLNLFYLEAYMIHQKFPIEHVWKEENLEPFDELILSWNGMRPLGGSFLFYVRVKTAHWSPWLHYATWGSEGQSSFDFKPKEAPVKVYQDAVEVLDGQKATGFQIKVVCEGLASLDELHVIHVYTNSDKDLAQVACETVENVLLGMPGLSQMLLNHVRNKHLCSPTSTTAVIRYLSNNSSVDPIDFAENVWDRGFDIYGNWVFNVAQASHHLGPEWFSWVERLSGFNDIYQSLIKGVPVVVSVKSPLPGSAQEYSQGHLIVITGYDALQQKIICMDPAFANDSETHVAYDLTDFLQAWTRRGKIAYIFMQNELRGQ